MKLTATAASAVRLTKTESRPSSPHAQFLAAVPAIITRRAT